MTFKCVLLPETEQVIDKSLLVYKKANPYRYRQPEKYSQIMNEFYAEESRRRMLFAGKIAEHIRQKDTLDVERVHSMAMRRENIINFMVDWCWTYNPKNLNRNLPVSIPWIPWPKQVEFIEWIYSTYLKPGRGLIEKSRDMGATWVFCMVFMMEWRYKKGFTGGFLSNKLDSVDKRDDPDCIFEKLRILMKSLPKWWLPEGFDWRKNDKIVNLANPENGANIGGAGGEDPGRGGRRGVWLVDEFASLENPDGVDRALSKNTDCEFDLSTPKGQNKFKEKRDSGRVDVFRLYWRDNPMLDDEWREHQDMEFDEVTVQQEIEINYHALVEDVFIRPEWVNAAVDLKLEKRGIAETGLDVAAGGTDLSALVHRIGPVIDFMEQWNIKNGSDLAHKAIEKSDELGTDLMHYDVIGVGHAVYSVLERTEMPIDFKCYGFDARGEKSDMVYKELKNRKAKDIFLNARSEAWYLLRRRFEKTYEYVKGINRHPEGELISIPNDTELINELSSPMRQFTETGKMKCESKDDMIKRKVKSPNKADACVMAFLPKDAGHKHVVDDFPVEDFKVFFESERPNCLQYAAVCQNEDLSIDIICCAWHEHLGHLFVHDEVHTEMSSSEEVAEGMIVKMQLRKFEIKKILGNKLMFAKDRKSVARSINKVLRRKMQGYQIVKIKEPMRYDPKGSMLMANNLIRKKKLTVNTKCREVIRQLSNWRLDKGKAKEAGMREGLLIVLSELVKIISFKEVMKNIEYHGKITEKQQKGYIRESL